MTNIDTQTTATAQGALVNDTRFDDLCAEFRKLGAKERAADKAMKEALESLPTAAQFIARNARSGVIDLNTKKDALHILHRHYNGLKANDKVTDKQGVRSMTGQVSKMKTFADLGSHAQFDGELALELAVKLHGQMVAAKDKPLSKYEALLVASRRMMDAAKETPARTPRLPAVFDVDKSNNPVPREDWKAHEFSDDEIKAAMRKKVDTKTALKVIKRLNSTLNALITGKKPYGDAKCDDQPLQDAHAAMAGWIATQIMEQEREALLAQAAKLGVNIQQVNKVLNPAPRAGRTKSQRRG